MEVCYEFFLKRALVFPYLFLLFFVKRLVFFAVYRLSVNDRIQNEPVFRRTEGKIEFSRLRFKFIVTFLHPVAVSLSHFGAEPFKILALHLSRDLLDETVKQLIHVFDELFAASRLHEKHIGRIIILEIEDIENIIRNRKTFCDILDMLYHIGSFAASRIARDIDVETFFPDIHSEVERLEPSFLERKKRNRLDFLRGFAFIFGKFRIVSQFFCFQFLCFKLHFFLL